MRSLARQTQDPVAWVVASLREDFKEELIARDGRGRFASKKGSKRSAADSKKRSSSLGKVAGVSAGAVAATVGVAALGAVYVASETRRASDDISGFDYPTEDPVDYSRYDDLKPGELLYKGFPAGPSVLHGGKDRGMLHYAVYVGKDPETGKHKLVECGEDPLHPGIPAVIESTIEDNIESLPKEKRKVSSHYKAVPKEERLPRKNEPPLSPDEIIERANLLVGQPFRYNAVTNNCESMARAIVGDEARTMQGERVSIVAKKIMSGIFDQRVFKGKWEEYGRSEFVKSSAEMAEILSDYSQKRISEAMWSQLKHVSGDWRTKKANAANVKENVYAAARAAAAASGNRRKDSEDDGHQRLADLLGLEPIDVYAKRVEEFAQASEDEVTQHLVRRQMWSNYFELALGSIHLTINGKTGDLLEDATLRKDFKEELIARDKHGRFSSKKGRASRKTGASGRRRSPVAAGQGKAAAVAATALGAAALGAVYVATEFKNASVDISDFDYADEKPVDYSRYDDLEPGTLMSQCFQQLGGLPHGGKDKGMLHFAVYLGKDEKTGHHMIVESGYDPNNPTIPAIIKGSIEDKFDAKIKKQGAGSDLRFSHFKPVPEKERFPPAEGKALSPEEIVDRANLLVGQPFRYNAVESNCESIARAIVGESPRSTQADGVTRVGKSIVNGLLDVVIGGEMKKLGKDKIAKTSKQMAEILSDYSNDRLSQSMQKELDSIRNEWISKREKATRTNENLYEECYASTGASRGKSRRDSEPEPWQLLTDMMGLEPIDKYADKVEEIASASEDKATQYLVRKKLWGNYFQIVLSTIHVAINGKTGDLKQKRADSRRLVIDVLRRDDFAPSHWWNAGDPTYKEMMAMAVVQDLRCDYKEGDHPRDALGRFAPKSGGGGRRLASVSMGKKKSSEEGGSSTWDRIAFPGGVATGLGIGALAVGGLAVGGSINTYKTIKEEGEKGASDISHMEFPGKGAEYDFSRYDDLEPGTMIRKGFRAPGMAEGKAFLHYAVYVGKDEKTGEHMVVHAVPDPKDKAGTVAIVKQSIEDAVKRGGDFELENHTYYEAMPEDERIRGKGVPSEAEAVERAESLIGQPYDYRSTRSNCESFARLITEGVAYETQGRGTASKAGMETVANLTKMAQDVARSRSEIWKGREPKDVHGWAEMLAKMQAGQLSEEAKAYMAENRAAWESAPELPVGGATKRNIKEMFEMAMKDFVNPGRKRSDAEGDNAIFDLLGMKTPAEYQKDIDRACEGQSKPLQRETARFMWSNYLQMFFALASDSKSPPKSLREDAERPWDEGKVKRGQGGRFAKKSEGGATSGMASPVGGSAGQVKQLAPRRAAHYSSSVMDVIKAGEELLGQIVQDPAVKEKILRVAEEAAVVKADEMRVRGEVVESSLAGDAEAAANGKIALNAIEAKQKGLTDFFDDDMEIAQNLKSGFKAMAKGTELRGEVKFDEEDSDYSPEDRAKARGMVEDAHRLFDLEPHTTVSMKKTTEMGEGRSCFRFDANEIQLSIEDEAADDRTKQKTLEVTTFHEMGHSVQKSNPEIGALERQFLADRKMGALESPDARAKVGGVLVETPDGGTATAVSMNALYGIEDVLHGNAPEASYGYGGTEIGVADSFVTPYVGTFHFEKTEETQSGETVASSGDMTAQFSEVFTVGVESMMRNPADFLKKDPDHFFLTLGLIAKQRSRAGRQDSWEEDKHPRDAQGRFAPASSARQSATSREFMFGGGNAYAKSQGKKTGLAGDAISAGQSYTKAFADDPKFVAAQKHMAEVEAKNHEATAQILARRERGQQPTKEEVATLIKAQADVNRVLHREFLPIATKKMEGVRNELLNDSPISKEEARAIVGQRQIKGRPFPEPLIGFQVKGMLEEHTRLIGEDLPTFKKMDIYSLTYGRSYADPANGVVAIAGGQINKPIIFHEATHHMEASNPRALRTAEDWVKQRNRGRGEMPLSLVNPAYGPNEKTMKDEFFNPYVGKLYKEGGKVAATEALSMGMQYFDSPKSMAMLYAVDPEHFHMTVGVIRPKGKGKSRKDAQEIRLDGLLSVPHGSSDYDKALIGRMNDNLKLNEKTGCFLWTASTRKDGYGQVKVNGELKSAHKVAYTLIKGKVPEGQLVCHKCDNPACCNPAHLFLGNSSKNVGDMVKKGRNSNGRGDSMEDLISLLREDADKGGPKRFGIWFEGRRTPVVVTANSRGEAIKRARLLKRRGGGRVASARVLNEQENRVADRGKWVRTGPSGEKPGESKIRGHGPKPKGFEE